MVHETQPHFVNETPSNTTIDIHRGEYSGLPYDEVGDRPTILVALHGSEFPF